MSAPRRAVSPLLPTSGSHSARTGGTARLAVDRSVRVGVGVLRRELMPSVCAVCSSAVGRTGGCHRLSIALPIHIGFRRNCFKVVRAHTAPMQTFRSSETCVITVVAQVINVVARRDRLNPPFVRNNMRTARSTGGISCHAVSVRCDSTCPVPATVGLLNAGVKRLFPSVFMSVTA